LVIIFNMIGFEKIVGQKKPIRVLKNLIRSNRIGHAFLFTGKEGIGKKITAIAFAKAINCFNLTENYEPCNRCSSCLKIEKNIHPDFQIITPLNSVITIEQIRNIKDIIYWQPLGSRKKVFLIDDAHKMTVQASNSLLKILEEPPQFAVLILITNSPETILPTIISRCHQISFHPINKGEQRDILMGMNFGLEKNQLEEIILFSSGNLGKAIELAGEPVKLKEKSRYIDWLIGTKPEEVMSKYFSSPENEVKDILNSFLEFSELMVLLFRDILFFQLGLPQEMLSFPERVERIKEFALYYSQEKIITLLNYLSEIPQEIDKYVKPEILMENFIIQLGD
jgi:DNA polymerase-3 subunit delta'